MTIEELTHALQTDHNLRHVLGLLIQQSVPAAAPALTPEQLTAAIHAALVGPLDQWLRDRCYEAVLAARATQAADQP